MRRYILFLIALTTIIFFIMDKSESVLPPNNLNVPSSVPATDSNDNDETLYSAPSSPPDITDFEHERVDLNYHTSN